MPVPRTRVALLHSGVTRFTQCLGRPVYRAECGRLIDGAVGLPTDAWPAKAAGQFICNAATERTDPMVTVTRYTVVAGFRVNDRATCRG
jgi:hypothetical protein